MIGLILDFLLGAFIGAFIVIFTYKKFIKKKR